MRASEWQFLCAVHEQPKSCCAIDYCCHTLDWAANVVSDQKLFPSRFAVLNDAHSKNVGVKNLVNVFRRLHRIFAHAWFQHRSVFWSVESQTGLYVFFKTVCDLYDLLPAENYKLPPEAEGLEGPTAETEPEKPPPAILKSPSQQRAGGEEDNLHPGGRTNTRRHIRSNPSTGSAVTTVVEADEEDAETVSNRMQSLRISGHQEPEVAEVPVIVEQSSMVDTPTDAASANSLAGDAKGDADAESDADQTVVEADSPADEDEEPNVVPITTADSLGAKDRDEKTASSEGPSSSRNKAKDDKHAAADNKDPKEHGSKDEDEPTETIGDSDEVPDPE